MLLTMVLTISAMIVGESGAQDTTIADPEERLFKYLTNSSKYEPKIRPGVLKDEKKMPLTVAVHFSPYRIIELDGRLETMSILMYITETWDDQRLIWNPEDFGGIKEISLKENTIWTPRTYLPNILVLNREDKVEALGARITSDSFQSGGNVRLLTYTLLQERCDFSMNYYPFDRQYCSICLSSSQYEIADLVYKANYAKASFFAEGGEWELEDGRVTNRSYDNLATSNPCMILAVRRKYLYYIINLFIPTICICLLNTIGLFASIDADQNELDFADMGQTTLLSLGVMLLTVAEQTPKGATEVSLLSIFFLAMLFQTLLAAMTAMFMRKWVKNHGDRNHNHSNPLIVVAKEIASRFVDPTKRLIQFCMAVHVGLILLITTTIIAIGVVNSRVPEEELWVGRI